MKLDSSIAAVVTGGASGLGDATVRALAAHGVKIAIFDLERQREQGEALLKEIGGGVFCPANVTSEEEIDAAFDARRAQPTARSASWSTAPAPATPPAPRAATARPARSRPSPPTPST